MSVNRNVQTTQFPKVRKSTKSIPICAHNVLVIMMSRNAILIDEEHPETHDELYAKYIRIVEEK